MRTPAAYLVIVLTALLLAACGEYATADWPDLAEGFEYTPTKPEAAPAPPAPANELAPAEIAKALAEGQARFETAKSEISRLMAEYEAAFVEFESTTGEATGRAWLGVQLALSRVSQAADSLTLLAVDLRRAEAQAGENGGALRALLLEVEAHKAEFDQQLIAERQRLRASRPG